MKPTTICVQPKNPFYLQRYIVLAAELISNNDTEGYAEVHHIVPRSMGGSDDLDNLISVNPKVHLRLHELLCKANFHKGLRWAYYNMTHMKNGEDFEYAREKKAEDMIGEGNPKFNSDINTWYHSGGRVFKGTSYALSKKEGIPRNYLCNVLSGKDPSAKGWKLSPEPTNGCGVRHGRSIKTKYRFIHDKHGERYCIPSDISREYPKAKNISIVAKGRRKSSAGWRLV